MQVFRVIIAVIAFITGVVFLVDLISNEFYWGMFAFSVCCFVCAYIIWPSKKKGQRADDYSFLDVLEFFIEVPVEILKWLVRVFGRIFSGKDGGFDLDL